jgi:hypothetical protein
VSPRLVVVLLVAMAARAANGEPAPLTITHDAEKDSLVIDGGRFRVVLTTEQLPAGALPSRTPSGSPIGCDCNTWEERTGSARRIRSIVLIVGARRRTVPRRLSDRLLSLHVADLRAAVSRDNRRLFVCGTLSDGAGSAMVLWSLSLVGANDWLRVGDLGVDWPVPTGACGEVGERAPELTGAARWPLLIQ